MTLFQTLKHCETFKKQRDVNSQIETLRNFENQDDVILQIETLRPYITPDAIQSGILQRYDHKATHAHQSLNTLSIAIRNASDANGTVDA